MDLIEVKRLVENEMRLHGLTDWLFKFDKSVLRAGCCNHNRKTISLSSKLMSLNSYKFVIETTRHEIAHALVFKESGSIKGHGKLWKKKALELGCTPSPFYRREDAVMPKGKYIKICPKCGIRGYSNRKRKVSCGRCSPVFDARYLLKYEPLAGP